MIDPQFVSPHKLQASELDWLKNQLKRQKLQVDQSGVLYLSQDSTGTTLSARLPPRAVLFTVISGPDGNGYYEGKILEMSNDGVNLVGREEAFGKIVPGE